MQSNHSSNSDGNPLTAARLRRGYGPIYRRLWRCGDEISLHGKAVLAHLLERLGQSSTAWPRQQRVAEDLGIGERTVREALRELEAIGFVATRRRGLGLPNEYTLNMGALLDWAERRTRTADSAGLERQAAPPDSAGPERPPDPVLNGSRGHTASIDQDQPSEALPSEAAVARAREGAAAAFPAQGGDVELAEKTELIMMQFGRKWQEDRRLLQDAQELADMMDHVEISEGLAEHRRKHPGKPPWPSTLRPILIEIIRRNDSEVNVP